MVEKKLIVTADYLGITKEGNQAILEGFTNGFLTQASLCANGHSFENAVCDILPDCQNLGISAALNIRRFKPLSQCNMLVDNFGNLNNTYISAFTNSKNPQFLEEVEEEFRKQLERICEYKKPSCINTIDNIHTIPEIFEITCKLAAEFDIKFVRTQYEEFYLVDKAVKHFNIKFVLNAVKLFLYNNLSQSNKMVADKYNLKTNDFIVGIGYNAMMDKNTILDGLEEIEEESVTELVLHPKKYSNLIKNNNTKEFGLIQNKEIETNIQRMGFDLTNYGQIS